MNTIHGAANGGVQTVTSQLVIAPKTEPEIAIELGAKRTVAVQLKVDNLPVMFLRGN